MAEKHDNQYTMPPLTHDQAVARFRELLSVGSARKRYRRSDAHDWLGLFAEWVRTDVGQYPNVSHFLKAKGIHPNSLERKGGRQFWNNCRDSVRVKAMIKSVNAAPAEMAKKFDKQLRIVANLEDAIIESTRKMQQPPDEPEPPGPAATASDLAQYKAELKAYRRELRAHNADAVKTLTEAMHKLAETNLMFQNEGVMKARVETVNIHAVLVDSMRQRDQKYGVDG